MRILQHLTNLRTSSFINSREGRNFGKKSVSITQKEERCGAHDTYAAFYSTNNLIWWQKKRRGAEHMMNMERSNLAKGQNMMSIYWFLSWMVTGNFLWSFIWCELTILFVKRGRFASSEKKSVEYFSFHLINLHFYFSFWYLTIFKTERKSIRPNFTSDL